MNGVLSLPGTDYQVRCYLKPRESSPYRS